MNASATRDAAHPCRICGGNAGARFRLNGFTWLRCALCRTTQKVLTAEQYLNLNPTYDPGGFLDSRDRAQVEAFLGVHRAVKVLERVIAAYLQSSTSASRSFLDVGCGMGGYLLAARQLGFDVLGFEPSVDHSRVATERLGLPVIRDYFTPAKLEGRTFDLIMLSHVIEHIYSPKEFLHDLISALRPGGALIVITPNNESLLASAVGRSWPMLKPVDHVGLIGPSAYEHFDLRDLEIHHRSSEYSFEWAASALSAMRASLRDSRRSRSTHVDHNEVSTPSPLKSPKLHARLVRTGLSLASAPMHFAAVVTGRQACLESVIVRKQG
jgi:SAM-dependent methyltransferase